MEALWTERIAVSREIFTDSIEILVSYVSNGVHISNFTGVAQELHCLIVEHVNEA
jgi:hypothetical protein